VYSTDLGRFWQALSPGFFTEPRASLFLRLQSLAICRSSHNIDLPAQPRKNLILGTSQHDSNLEDCSPVGYRYGKESVMARLTLARGLLAAQRLCGFAATGYFCPIGLLSSLSITS
jgi:hypothetical protein